MNRVVEEIFREKENYSKKIESSREEMERRAWQK